MYFSVFALVSGAAQTYFLYLRDRQSGWVSVGFSRLAGFVRLALDIVSRSGLAPLSLRLRLLRSYGSSQPVAAELEAIHGRRQVRAPLQPHWLQPKTVKDRPLDKLK